MRGAQVRDGLERTLVDIYKSPAAILFLGAVMFARLVVVAKQAREELVNNRFIHSRLYAFLKSMQLCRRQS